MKKENINPTNAILYLISAFFGLFIGIVIIVILNAIIRMIWNF